MRWQGRSGNHKRFMEDSAVYHNCVFSSRNWRSLKMKKNVGTQFLFLLLAVILVTPVHASVTTQAVINQDIQVTFDFSNISPNIYENITITDTTIPETIKNTLAQQGLTNVDYRYVPLDFNSTENSLRAAFILFGSDILNITVNTDSMTNTYHVRTDWRKFQVNLTNEVSLNFAEYFGEPIENWQRINYTLNGKEHPTYYYNFTDSNTFDPTCYFILPTEATDVQAVGDIITFELPLSFGDSLLNSPFLILGAIIVVIIAFFLYRKIIK